MLSQQVRVLDNRYSVAKIPHTTEAKHEQIEILLLLLGKYRISKVNYSVSYKQRNLYVGSSLIKLTHGSVASGMMLLLILIWI